MLYARADSVETYCTAAEYNLLKSEVTKLAEGYVDDRVWTFIAGRREFPTTSRDGQKAHFEKRPGHEGTDARGARKQIRGV